MILPSGKEYMEHTHLIYSGVCCRIYTVKCMKLKAFLKTTLYLLWQFSFGIIQSLIGFVLFLKFAKCPHEFYHGAILTYHNGKFGGISLGAFIFVAQNRPQVWTKDARVHEYGHTIQSMLLGPLYMTVIAIPSMIWCNTKSLHQKRMRGEMNYYDLYCENSANTLGALVTKEEKPKRENTGEELRRRGIIKD